MKEKLLLIIYIKFGWIFYRNPVDSPSDKNDYIDLTDVISRFKSFISTMKSYGGNDKIEDWVGGYNIVLNNIH